MEPEIDSRSVILKKQILTSHVNAPFSISSTQSHSAPILTVSSLFQTHPDLNPNNPAKHKEFVLINEAYSVLRDSKQREDYDASLRSPGGSDNFGSSYSSGSYSQYETYRSSKSGPEDFTFHSSWNPKTQ